ncbi:nuclear transport factor 2 family protein [Sphingomonas sp. MMS24-JH45]
MTDPASRLREYYTVYNRGDADALHGFYAEDLVVLSPHGRIDGRAAMIEVCRGMMVGFTDVMTPTRILAVGNVAVAEIEDVLTARVAMPDFLGAPVAAGECRVLNLAGIYTFVGDRISSVSIYAR